MFDSLIVTDATNLGHMGGWGWGMMLVWSVFAVAVVLSVVWAITRVGQTQPPTDRGRPNPGQLLAERFARGEIDEEEFRVRRAALRSADEV
jgi:putative membrane protein